MHSVMPRLMEAQSGPGVPQSQHRRFPATARTRSRASSPSPSRRSTGPPVDAESRRCLCEREKRGEEGRRAEARACARPRARPHRTALGLVEGRGDAVLHGADPRLLPPLRVGLQQTAPAPASASVAGDGAAAAAAAGTHLDGETTSKQKRLSFSPLGLTVHRRRSSTTTVGCS